MKVTDPIDVFLADKLFQLTSSYLPEGHSTDEYRTMLEGTVMVVLGGSYGIGADIAALAREHGATVETFSRSTTNTHVERRPTWSPWPSRWSSEHGRIDFVVASAGVLPRGSLLETTEETIFAATEVNYLAPVFIAQVFFPHLRETSGQPAALHLEQLHARVGAATASTPRPRPRSSTSPRRWPTSGVRAGSGQLHQPRAHRHPDAGQGVRGGAARVAAGVKSVAQASLDMLLSAGTGHVVDLRKLDPLADPVDTERLWPPDLLRPDVPARELPSTPPPKGSMRDTLKPSTRLSGPPLDRVTRLARSAPERVRRATDGVRIRTRRAVHRRGYVPRLLSVVVPCYLVEDFLDECLVSLRFQDYRDVEIIVVDDGSPDRSGEIARSHARRDLRVRVVTRENGGLSAARNTGIEHARGEFLTFVDSDDVVTADAYTSAIGALTESGSDFVVNGYDRLENKKRVPAGSWIRHAHLERRLGVDLDTFPEAMVNAVAWSKTYRRAFWDRAGLRFPEGSIYEDQPVSAAAYAQARAFDVVPEVGVSWRIRNDRSSISQSAWSADNLAAHNESVAASFVALRAAGKERAVQVRALQLISYNMPFFTRHLAKGGPEFWQHLREGLLDLLPRVSREEFVHSVAAHDKVLAELIAGDRREAAVAYLEDWGSDTRRSPTRPPPRGCASSCR